MQAFILCGGMGTRLRSVINDKPKPMAEIAGKPFLEYLMLYFRRYGFTDFIISTGYRAEQFSEYFAYGEAWGISIQYSHETEPLDTGGALKLAEPLFKSDTVLVSNGDSIFDADLNEMLEVHRRNNALVTMALAHMADISRYGGITVEASGRISAFNEKAASGSGLVNAGIYLVDASVLSRIPSGERQSLERDLFPSLVGDAFYGVPFEGRLIDIGTPESYGQVCDDPSPLLKATGLVG